MIYDYLIIGSGIAGAVCSYLLSKKGYTCLILEKRPYISEKICGGGVSKKALHYLQSIGMPLQELFAYDSCTIKQHIIFRPETVTLHQYKSGKVALGIQRRLFDTFLLKQSLAQGTTILYNQTVSTFQSFSAYYQVNEHYAHHIISATGARGFIGKGHIGQSYGISAQLIGKCLLSPHTFYYWYPTSSDTKYFWIFPIGKQRWNIGAWFRYPTNNLSVDYKRWFYKYITINFPQGYTLAQLPKGEFLGNIDQRIYQGHVINGIGDFAGKNNIKNGGGIVYAIESAISYAKSQPKKSTAIYNLI